MMDKRLLQESPDRDVKTDRRRPGRGEYPNPALIRMMRGTYDAALHELHRLDATTTSSPDAKDASDGRDDLRPARGIAVAVGLGAASWVVIGATIWLLLRLL